MIGAGTFAQELTIQHSLTLNGKGIGSSVGTVIHNIVIDEGVTGLTLDGLTIVHGDATNG